MKHAKGLQLLSFIALVGLLLSACSSDNKGGTVSPGNKTANSSLCNFSTGVVGDQITCDFSECPQGATYFFGTDPMSTTTDNGDGTLSFAVPSDPPAQYDVTCLAGDNSPIMIQKNFTILAPVVQNACTVSTDCPQGKTCRGGQCQSPAPSYTPPPPPQPCTTNANCSTGQVCQGGQCVVSMGRPCTSNAICLVGQSCQNGVCAATPPPPPPGPTPLSVSVRPTTTGLPLGVIQIDWTVTGRTATTSAYVYGAFNRLPADETTNSNPCSLSRFGGRYLAVAPNGSELTSGSPNYQTYSTYATGIQCTPGSTCLTDAKSRFINGTTWEYIPAPNVAPIQTSPVCKITLPAGATGTFYTKNIGFASFPLAIVATDGTTTKIAYGSTIPQAAVANIQAMNGAPFVAFSGPTVQNPTADLKWTIRFSYTNATQVPAIGGLSGCSVPRIAVGDGIYTTTCDVDTTLDPFDPSKFETVTLTVPGITNSAAKR
ncbi:MAG: hypothetical protein HY073_01765, partial [Deltaproteobacteria bacterium]|nr:hypothetical protein [Deltaproteobacteria bacterium]